MVRCLRICLPMQRTWVRSLVWEDPTGHGATKPMCHNFWACTLQLRKPSGPLTTTRETPVHSNKDPGQPRSKRRWGLIPSTARRPTSASQGGGPQKKPHLQTPWPQTPSFQDYEAVHCCGLRPTIPGPCLRCFVMAAMPYPSRASRPGPHPHLVVV